MATRGMLCTVGTMDSPKALKYILLNATVAPTYVHCFGIVCYLWDSEGTENACPIFIPACRPSTCSDSMQITSTLALVAVKPYGWRAVHGRVSPPPYYRGPPIGWPPMKGAIASSFLAPANTLLLLDVSAIDRNSREGIHADYS